MRNHEKSRGGAWGAGIGLLALLIVVAIGIYLWSESIMPESATQPTPKKALDQAEGVVDTLNKRAEDMNRKLQPATATAPEQ